MYNKLMKKDEILELLQNTKVILKPEMTEYLESIINLEFSVVKDNISDPERKALKELQVYRSSLIYNIYKRDIEYFNNEYKNNGIKFFNFYVNENDMPTIKLLIKIHNGNFKLNPELQSQIKTIRSYFDRLKDDYDLKENSFTSGKKYVKKMPGLVIKKDIEIY